MSSFWLSKEQCLEWEKNHTPSKALDRVGIRRLLLVMKKQIDSYLHSINNSEESWHKISDSIKTFIVDLAHELYSRKAFKTYVIGDQMFDDVRKITVSIQPHTSADYVDIVLEIKDEQGS